MPRNAALLLLLLAPTLLVLALPAHAQPGPGGPPAVGVVAAAPRPITDSSSFSGRIQAAARVDLVARVTATLAERAFAEGSEVAAGDLLFRLDPAQFAAELAVRQAAVAQTAALLRNATLALNRARSLMNSSAGRASAVDDAVAQQASLAAQLQAAEAQAALARLNLGYTEIRAPIAGRIGRATLSAGNVVAPASGPLATIVSQDPMHVLFPVSLRALLDLQARHPDLQALRIRVRLADGRIHEPAGRLDYADPSVAASTDSLMLRAAIPNPLRPGARPGDPASRNLLDGAFVTVLVEGAAPVARLAVPRAAVLADQQGSYVYVVDAEKRAQQRRVTLGPATPTLAVILTGLAEGDSVVVDGLQRVRPGAPVNPVPAGAPPPGAPSAPAAPRG